MAFANEVEVTVKEDSTRQGPARFLGPPIKIIGSASTTGTRMEARAEIEARRASSTAAREARQASSTERRLEVKQNIAKRQMERAAKMLSATIERLENILARLESRIAKVKAEGALTTESEGYVADTKAYLAEARADLAVFAAIEVTSDNFETVREAGAEVKTEIRKAHESLVNALRTLKPGRYNSNASSTVEVSN